MTPVDHVAPGQTGTVEIAMLLESLHPDRREAFVLTQILGLSYAETAEVTDTRLGTVRSRVARARAELAGLLQRSGDRVGSRP